MKRRRPQQLPLSLHPRGGRRPGAGRKPSGARAGVAHTTRPRLASRFPVHVTLKLRSELGNLRRGWVFKKIEAALRAGCCQPGFRLCHFSVQDGHIHLIVEAHDANALSRGIQGLSIRIARRLNRALGRRGKVFADRFHARILRTPREVKNALNYVLNNRLRHAPIVDGDWLLLWEDWASSAAWFDGWRKRARGRWVQRGEPPVAEARTWLLTKGWRRHGLLEPVYNPKGSRRKPPTEP